MPVTERQRAVYRSLQALDDEGEAALRARYAEGGSTYSQLVAEFGVSKATVHRILNRESSRAKKAAYEGRSQDAIADYRLRRAYGITLDDYNRLYDEQAGACAACEEPIERRSKSTHVDHCHERHVVRGLLCHWCNTALGMLNEDPDRIWGLLRYAEDKCGQRSSLDELGS